jgi:hypothetical protein
MNRKQRSRNQPAQKISAVPVVVEQPRPRKTRAYLTKQWLNQVAAGTEKGIRDTYAWKDAVKRLGLKEARKRLRLSLLANQIAADNPQN